MEEKYYADLYYWDGKTETIEIKKEFIQDILDAVEGQYLFTNNITGLCVAGYSIRHVDIWKK
ncbi:MAG: hypothetical protein RR342_03765 [Bacilli bacterium]|jgi:hypothetical protein